MQKAADSQPRGSQEAAKRDPEGSWKPEYNRRQRSEKNKCKCSSNKNLLKEQPKQDQKPSNEQPAGKQGDKWPQGSHKAA